MNGDLFPELKAHQRPSLFLAILPPAEVRQPIVDIQQNLIRTHGPMGYVTAANKLHITLCHFNNNPEPLERIIENAKKACERVAAMTEPFEIRLNQILRFVGGPIVLIDRTDNLNLCSFHESLMAEFKDLRFILRKNSKFTPHLTLLRDQRGIRENPIEPIAWVAKEVVLVRHVPKQDYEIIGPWEFSG